MEDIDLNLEDFVAKVNSDLIGSTSILRVVQPVLFTRNSAENYAIAQPSYLLKVMKKYNELSMLAK